MSRTSGEAAMNKRGMTRQKSVAVKQTITVLKVPETKTKGVPDVFVVHVNGGDKLVFSSYGPAFKKFKEESGRKLVSVALWRGPKWTRLYATPHYPDALREPYVNLWMKVQS